MKPLPENRPAMLLLWCFPEANVEQYVEYGDLLPCGIDRGCTLWVLHADTTHALSALLENDPAIVRYATALGQKGCTWKQLPIDQRLAEARTLLTAVLQEELLLSSVARLALPILDIRSANTLSLSHAGYSLAALIGGLQS